MKKAILILVMLSWCNLSIAEDSELDISIKKATQETDIIKINEAYSLKCEAEIEDLRFTINQKVFKSKILKSEVIMIFEGEKIYFKIDSKINSKGKLSGTKLKVHYSPDFDKDIKILGKKYDLPNPISRHGSFWTWGYGNKNAEIWISLGNKKQVLRHVFEEIELVKTITHKYAVAEENNIPLYICRKPKIDIENWWQQYKDHIYD